MRNVTTKELDECLIQLNNILAKLDSRIETLEKKAKESSSRPRRTAKKADENE